jgi:hypothetical protein
VTDYDVSVGPGIYGDSDLLVFFLLDFDPSFSAVDQTEPLVYLLYLQKHVQSRDISVNVVSETQTRRWQSFLLLELSCWVREPPHFVGHG